MLIHLQWPGPPTPIRALSMLEDSQSAGTYCKSFIPDCNAEVEGKNSEYKGRNSHMEGPMERTMAVCYTSISAKG